MQQNYGSVSQLVADNCVTANNYSVLSLLDQDHPLDLSKCVRKSLDVNNNSNIGAASVSQNANISNPLLEAPFVMQKLFEELLKRRTDWPSPYPGSSNSGFFPPLPPPPPLDPRLQWTSLWHRLMNSVAQQHSTPNSSGKLQNPQLETRRRPTLSPRSLTKQRHKRTKVTDSRLLKRATIGGEDPSIDFSSSALINEDEDYENRSILSRSPSVNDSELDDEPNNLNHNSNISQSSLTAASLCCNDPKKYTLTPVHLRKAKLMFLYTRYPNSQMLKSFFPDILFYKQNTAQLVKWFSNFREFYYSEMEKAVQRYLSGGIKFSTELIVTEDSELFKNLMTHFNKNSQIEVPKEFMMCVQVTLREFYEAISVGKNLHQSWKKPIYKNIAKLDQPLPEFFRDLSWMLELARDDSNSGSNNGNSNNGNSNNGSNNNTNNNNVLLMASHPHHHHHHQQQQQHQLHAPAMHPSILHHQSC